MKKNICQIIVVSLFITSGYAYASSLVDVHTIKPGGTLQIKKYYAPGSGTSSEECVSSGHFILKKFQLSDICRRRSTRVTANNKYVYVWNSLKPPFEFNALPVSVQEPFVFQYSVNDSGMSCDFGASMSFEVKNTFSKPITLICTKTG